MTARFPTCIIILIFAVRLTSDRVLLADNEKAWKIWKETFDSKVLKIMKAKCWSCHNSETAEGELNLSKYENGELAFEAGDIWERVAKRVRLDEMPPQGSSRLSDPEKTTFHRWIDSRPLENFCNQIATDDTQSWYQGYVMSRRLSRFEYGNALFDLAGRRLQDDELPPTDGSGGEGFDTVGDSLFTSTIHLEAYLRATDLAVADFLEKPAQETKLDIRRFRESIDSLATSLTADETKRLASEFIEAFGKRAWRRPLLPAELVRLLGLFETELASKKDTLHAIRQTIKAILISPHFLFLVESDPGARGVQQITPHQFATRMAMLVWSSIPDHQLLEFADQGTIFEPEIILSELKRMLADPRSRSLGENFGLQWLGLREFLQSKPEASLFPDYNAALANDAREETIRFVANVFQNDRPLTDLIDSDYLFLTKRLADYYGLPFDGQTEWIRVNLSKESTGSRGGVLTMISTLTRTSYPRRTSPVLRGRWILEDLLGSKVPPPPPNVPALEEADHQGHAQTLRERLELHRQKPECASCHDRMDPLGFGLENYDAVGRWRTDEAGVPLDTRGTLPSGETFQGPAELKQVLLNRKDEFQKHFVQKLTGYALGRQLNKFDQCIIDSSLKRLAEENRATVILEEILLSYAFRHRYFN